jgi:hypothetical protein
MPLTDLGEDLSIGDETRFDMSDGVHRVAVRVSRQALETVEARSGAVGFEVHRPAFAALASRKFAKGRLELDGSVLLDKKDV